MNKKLYGKEFEVPGEVVEYLDKCFNAVKSKDESVEGYKRNRDLVKNKKVSYSVLKRIKNFFDTYQGNKKDAPFVLNGADYMKNWVDSTLEHSRRNIKSANQHRKDAGMETEYVDKFSSQQFKPRDVKKDITNMDIQVTESLKRINELMKKIL